MTGSGVKQQLLWRLLAEQDHPPGRVPRLEGTRPPASLAQARLWLFERLQPATATYHVPMALRLHGRVDTAAMQCALDQVVARHDALRTSFVEERGALYQQVASQVDTPLKLTRLGGVPVPERAAALEREALEEIGRPFDLTAGPLLRCSLFELEPEEHVLLLTAHHLVTDAWSMGVLWRELAACYAAVRGGRRAALPELPLQYPDFAAWQRARLDAGAFERQERYWRERLAGAPTSLDLPTDRPRLRTPSYRGGNLELALPARLVERLRELARQERATSFSVLLAGLVALLHRQTAADDVVVGIPVAGRDHAELQPLIGYFVNLLPVRVELAAAGSFRALLRQVHEAVVGALANAEVPFERLVEQAGAAGTLEYTPLLQVTFSMTGATPPARTIGELRSAPVFFPARASKFELSLALVDGSDGPEGVWEYSADLFDEPTVRRWGARLRTLLDDAAAHPDRRVARLRLLPADERDLLLRWSRGKPTSTGPHPPADERLTT